jgi:hypothetical protein
LAHQLLKQGLPPWTTPRGSTDANGPWRLGKPSCPSDRQGEGKVLIEPPLTSHQLVGLRKNLDIPLPKPVAQFLTRAASRVVYQCPFINADGQEDSIAGELFNYWFWGTGSGPTSKSSWGRSRGCRWPALYRRFDLIEVGMTLSEAEAAIGMKNNGMKYSGRRPELVAGRDTDHGSLVFSADGRLAYGLGGEASAAYQYDRYTIVIHFEPGPDERVTGKGLFRSVEPTGLAERLFGP